MISVSKQAETCFGTSSHCLFPPTPTLMSRVPLLSGLSSAASSFFFLWNLVIADVLRKEVIIPQNGFHVSMINWKLLVSMKLLLKKQQLSMWKWHPYAPHLQVLSWILTSYTSIYMCVFACMSPTRDNLWSQVHHTAVDFYMMRMNEVLCGSTLGVLELKVWFYHVIRKRYPSKRMANIHHFWQDQKHPSNWLHLNASLSPERFQSRM